MSKSVAETWWVEPAPPFSIEEFPAYLLGPRLIGLCDWCDEEFGQAPHGDVEEICPECFWNFYIETDK